MEIIEVKDFNILIVEDNDVIGRVMSTIFLNAGCSVSLAITGKDALEYFYNNKYNLILMDIGLPDHNGLYFSKVIRNFHDKDKAKTPIAIITAHSDVSQHVLEAKNLGIEDFIVKPCTINTCYMLIKKYALAEQSYSSKQQSG